MKLNYQAYRDKVYACWTGKNIGGTMGTPFEGMRQINDIQGFSTAPGVVLPNDDLDLQLVWLYALEQNGPHAINAQMLGEHWISYITPHWNEYGLGKANMKRGLPPPLAGDYDNDWNNSNGAWIRTEIWACVAPGMPHVAARYAMEDAMVDHGAGEGTFAAAFVAAMQSAAFVIPDLRKCIEIGMNAIPATSRMAKSIKFVLKCYEDGMDWKDARWAVQKLNADIGDGWFEAPSNVTYSVIGLLWGEGDFKKSMITAINCGDDTDCTGATCGATLGILYGTKGIPSDWCEYIGDSIVTISIAQGHNGATMPSTCSELSERVCKLAPVVLASHGMKFTTWITTRVYDKFEVELGECDEIPEDIFDKYISLVGSRVRVIAEKLVPYSMHFENVFLHAQVTLGSAPEIEPEGEIKVHLDLQSLCCFEDEPRTLYFRWWLPEGFSVKGRKNIMVHGFNPHSLGHTEVDFVIKAGENVDAENRIVLEINGHGRCTPLYCSFPLLG